MAEGVPEDDPAEARDAVEESMSVEVPVSDSRRERLPRIIGQRWWVQAHPAFVGALCTFMIAAVLVFDLLTPAEWIVAGFYLVPIALLAVGSQRRWSVVAAVVSFGLTVGVSASKGGLAGARDYISFVLFVGVASALVVVGDLLRQYDATWRQSGQRERLARAESDIVGSLTGRDDLDAALVTAVARMARELGASASTLALLEGRRWVARAGTGYRAPEPGSEVPFDGLPSSAAAVAEGRVVTMEDVVADGVTREPSVSAVLADAGVHAGLVAPLMTSGGPVGVAMFGRPTAGTFAPEEIEFAERTASYLAAAIANERLVRELDAKRQDLSLVVESSLEFAVSLEPTALLQSVVQRMVAALGVTGCDIYVVVEPERTAVRTVVSYDHGEFASPESEHAGTLYALEQFTSTAHVVRTGRSLVITDLDDPHLSQIECDLLREQGQRCQFGIPLKARDRVIGVVELYDSVARREFSSEEIALAEAVCRFAAVALDNATLFETVEQRSLAQRDLVELAGLVAAAVDVDELLRAVAKRLVDSLEVADCDIFLLEGDQLFSRVSYDRDGYDEVALGHALRVDEYSVTKMAIDTRQMVVLSSPDDPRFDDYEREVMAKYGFVCNVCIPLVVEDRVQGVVDIWDDKPNDFSQVLDFLRTVAQMVAAALQKQLLLERITHRSHVLRELVELGAAIWRARDIDTLVRDVASRLAGATGVACCEIYRLDEGALRCAASYSTKTGYDDSGLGRPLRIVDFPATASAIETGEPTVIASADDPRLKASDLDIYARDGFQSELCLPLVVEDRVVGLLDLFDDHPRDYAEYLDFILSAGQMIAGVFENVSLLGRLNEANDELESLVGAGLEFGASLDLEAVLDSVASHMCAAVDADTCDIYAIEEDRIRGLVSVDRDAPDPAFTGIVYPIADLKATAQVMAALRPVVVKDIEAEGAGSPLEREEWGRYGLRSGVVLPLVAAGQPVGIAGIHSKDVRDWGSPTLLVGLAQVAAQAITNASVHADLERSNRQLNELVEASREFAATLDVDRVLVSTAARMREAAGVACCEIFSLEGDVGRCRVSVSADGVDESMVGHIVDTRAYSVREMIEEPHEPMVIVDVLSDSRATEADKAHHENWGYRSIMRLPLLAAGVLQGWVSLYDTRARDFSHREFLVGLAQLASRALANASLYRELDETTSRLRVVNETSSDLSSTLSLDTILYATAERLCQIAGVPCCDIYTVSNGVQTCVASVKDGGISTSWIGFQVPVGEWASDELAMITRQTVVLRSADDPLRSAAEIASLEGTGFESQLSIPLFTTDRAIGVVELLDRRRDREWAPEVVTTIEAVCRSATLAIGNAQLYSAERMAARRLERLAGQLQSLQEISLRLNRLRDERRALDEVVRFGVELLGVERAAYAVRDAEVVQLRAFYSARSEWTADEGEAEAALDTLRDVMSRLGLFDGDRETTENAVLCDDSLVVALKRHRPDAVAALIFSAKVEEGGFSEEDQRLATTLAAQLSLTLRNIHAYQREHRIAEEFQDALLVSPPPMAGVDLGVRYVPAGEAARVGGDFYDFVRLGGNRFMVAIGDVCGRGLEAAAQTAVVRYMLRAYAAESSPGEALSRLNATIAGQSPSLPFVTLLVAYVDVARHSLDYAAAGHPRPIVFAGTHRFEIGEEGGYPIGVFPTSTYKTNRCVLPGDTTVVVYTDGLTEARRRGVVLREDRLVRMIRRHVAKPAQLLADTLAQRARRYGGEPLKDDIAVVVVKLP